MHMVKERIVLCNLTSSQVGPTHCLNLLKIPFSPLLRQIFMLAVQLSVGMTHALPRAS